MYVFDGKGLAHTIANVLARAPYNFYICLPFHGPSVSELPKSIRSIGQKPCRALCLRCLWCADASRATKAKPATVPVHPGLVCEMEVERFAANSHGLVRRGCIAWILCLSGFEPTSASPMARSLQPIHEEFLVASDTSRCGGADRQSTSRRSGDCCSSCSRQYPRADCSPSS